MKSEGLGENWGLSENWDSHVLGETWEIGWNLRDWVKLEGRLKLEGLGEIWGILVKLEGLGEIWGKVGTWGIRWNLRHFGETGEKGETGEIPLHLKGENLGIWWSLYLNNKEKP